MPLPNCAAQSAIASARSRSSRPPATRMRTSKPSPVCIGRSAPGHQPLRSAARAHAAALSICFENFDRRIAPRNPEAAPARLFETFGHAARGLRIGGDEKGAHALVAARRVEQKIEMPARRGVGQRGIGEEIVERLGDLRRAAMAVAHLAGDPARIDRAAAQHARDLLSERPHRRFAAAASYRRDRARASRRGVRRRRRNRPHARRRRRNRARPAPPCPAHGRKRRRAATRVAERFARFARPRRRRHRHGSSPRDRRRQVRRAPSIRRLRARAPGRRHSARARRRKCAATARRPCATSGLSSRLSLKRRDSLNRLMQQRDLGGEDVAEQARDAQGHVDPRAADHRERQNLVAVHAVRGVVPGGRTPSRAKACAISSPPVRIVALPQRSSTMRRGHSP